MRAFGLRRPWRRSKHRECAHLWVEKALPRRRSIQAAGRPKKVLTRQSERSRTARYCLERGPFLPCRGRQVFEAVAAFLSSFGADFPCLLVAPLKPTRQILWRYSRQRASGEILSQNQLNQIFCNPDTSSGHLSDILAFVILGQVSIVLTNFPRRATSFEYFSKYTLVLQFCILSSLEIEFGVEIFERCWGRDHGQSGKNWIASTSPSITSQYISRVWQVFWKGAFGEWKKCVSVAF